MRSKVSWAGLICRTHQRCYRQWLRLMRKICELCVGLWSVTNFVQMLSRSRNLLLSRLRWMLLTLSLILNYPTISSARIWINFRWSETVGFLHTMYCVSSTNIDGSSQEEEDWWCILSYYVFFVYIWWHRDNPSLIQNFNRLQ